LARESRVLVSTSTFFAPMSAAAAALAAPLALLGWRSCGPSTASNTCRKRCDYYNLRPESNEGLE
jgi:hypothetical protein